MEIGRAFRRVASVVDAVDDSHCHITDVETPANELLVDGTLAVDLTVALPLSGDELPESTSVSVNAAEIEDGELLIADLTIETAAETDPASADEASKSTEDRSPYYENRERLQQVYDDYETFAEMTDALGVDVTPATVRQHMVKHGIHETSGSATGDAGDPAEDTDPDSAVDPARTRVDGTGEDGRDAVSDSRQDDSNRVEGTDEAIADGLGLPDDISMDELKDVVQSSQTFHEAQRRMGLDRDDAQRLLAELDLLDFVMGRLATADHRSISRQRIDERIRSATVGRD